METYIKLVKVFPVNSVNGHYVNDVLKVVRYFSAGCIAEDNQGRETPFKAEQYETLPKYKIVEDTNDNYDWHGFAIGEIVHLLDTNTVNQKYKRMFGKSVHGKLITQLVHENLLEPVHEQKEEKRVKYTEKDIKEGMQLRCTDGGSFGFWEEGKIYTVTKLNNGQIGFHGDEMLGRTSRNAKDIAHYLNGNLNAKFELLNEEDNKNMYTVGDLVKINDDLRAGCEYTVYCNDDMETYRGKKAVIVDVDTVKSLFENESKIYKLQDMNGETIEWSFTDDMFKFTENTTEPPFKVGDKVRVLNNATLASKADGNFYRTGDIDVVGYVECYKNSKGGRIRLGTHGSANWIHFDMIELVEEAPEKLGYFKCTAGSIFRTKGKIYPVSYDENTKLYTIANDDGEVHAEPTLELLIQYATHKIKATMIYMNDTKEDKKENKDINKVSDLLQAKIDELTTQAEHLFKKRDRLDEHAKNLNAKARRLEEVLDELNKFK